MIPLFFTCLTYLSNHIFGQTSLNKSFFKNLTIEKLFLKIPSLRQFRQPNYQHKQTNKQKKKPPKLRNNNGLFKNGVENSPSYVFGAIERLPQLKSKLKSNIMNLLLFVDVIGHSKCSWHDPGYLRLVVQPLENEQRAWWNLKTTRLWLWEEQGFGLLRSFYKSVTPPHHGHMRKRGGGHVLYALILCFGLDHVQNTTAVYLYLRK